MVVPDERHPASFRDPSGFVFRRDDTLYRQVNACARDDYDQLMGSGLHRALVADGLLVDHEEADVAPAAPGLCYRVLRPDPVPFVSYPYEWCFSELRAAALATLRIQRRALEHGMTLKDASAFNIQFRGTTPVLIDTLSLARHRPGRPWDGYRQFCQHFLAPLALSAFADARLSQLSRIWIDGVPLDLASRLLPRRTWMQAGLLSHLHLHARSQQRFADVRPSAGERPTWTVRPAALQALVEHLERTVAGLAWRPRDTPWLGYYGETNYAAEAMEQKLATVDGWLDRARPRSVWDLGANVGRFSALAARRGIPTVAFDVDAAAVDAHYRASAANGRDPVLPLVCDLLNPSPALGWHHRERASLRDRGPTDLVLALALVHHLAIGSNVPLGDVAAFLADLAGHVVLEFVPKDDSQVARMLATRDDIFPDYSLEGLERAFARYFVVHARTALPGSSRTLLLMERRSA